MSAAINKQVVRANIKIAGDVRAVRFIDTGGDRYRVSCAGFPRIAILKEAREDGKIVVRATTDGAMSTYHIKAKNHADAFGVIVKEFWSN